MPRPPEIEFTTIVQSQALARQQKRCASCGETISQLGETGRMQNRFAEIGHAHHLRHASAGGTGDLFNCVILCQSCHYTVHEGGNYRFGTVRRSFPSDYPYFNG